MGPARPASQYEVDDDEDLELEPCPVSELMVECFTAASGGAVGVPAADTPVIVMIMENGTVMAYQVCGYNNDSVSVHAHTADRACQHTLSLLGIM